MVRSSPDTIKPAAVAVSAAARAIGLGERTAWKLVASGELRSIRVGSRRLIPVAAIDDFIRSRMEAPGDAIPKRR